MAGGRGGGGGGGGSALVIGNLCFPCIDGSHRTSREGVLAAGEQH